MGDLAHTQSPISMGEAATMPPPQSEGRWVLSKKFKTQVMSGTFKGCTNDHKIVLNRCEALFTVNLEDQTTHLVTETPREPYITNCAPLPDSRVVCGNQNGSLVLYDQTWKRMQKIQTKSRQSSLVTVGKDGHILATSRAGSVISVIHPDSGVHVQTINVAKNLDVICEMHALQSGDIAVHSKGRKGSAICILDRSGTVIATTHLHKKNVLNFAVDYSSDAIFVLHDDHQHSVCKVDMISPSGQVLTEDIIKFRPRGYFPPCLAIPISGKIAIFRYGEILVYRNMQCS